MAKLKENSKIVKASGEELIATEPKVLSMIQENAYVHPATHPASMITGLASVAISGDYNDLINKPDLEDIVGDIELPPDLTEEVLALQDEVARLENEKVDKEAGKGLSTRDFLPEYEQKLAGIEPGANKYIHPETHPASMITGLHPSATTGVAGSVAWDNVTGKPSTFTPSEHTHEEYSTVQALDAHTETRAALNKLGHVYHATLTATLNTSGWTGTEAPFVQAQAVSGILATDTPIVDVVLSGDWEVDEARLEAWGYIYRIVTSNGSITAYAKEKPNVALPLQLKVVR